MRRPGAKKNRDGNERSIVDALRRAGATTFQLDQPADLLVGVDGRNYLLEIKNPNAERGLKQALALTEVEARFHERWYGQVCVVTTEAEALEACGL